MLADIMNVSRVRELGKVRELGEFIRNQRRATGVSLRKLASLAGVSNPYLSQVERGLRRPSAEMLQAIAKGLRISANTLYVKAGFLEAEPKADIQAAITADAGLTERQKQALLAVYDSFRDETERRRTQAPGGGRSRRTDGTSSTALPDLRAPRERPTRSRTGGRAKTQADAKPSPGSPSSSRPQPRTRSKGGA
jgi:transcriptional regulator with XRE-family HTH domain